MRRLDCTRCGERVTVYELPVEFIDPSVYVCGQCLEPVAGQLELGAEREPETVRYDPSMSEIPF